MRAAIIGNSGSGKSTLARRLADTCGAQVLDLDSVAWETGLPARPRDAAAAAADVKDFCSSTDRWVVEGCYANLIGVALEWKPLLLFLDPGLEKCRENCRRRPWEPHKYASRAEQDAGLPFLLDWVEGYYWRSDDPSFAAHKALLDAYTGSKHHLVELPGAGFRPG